MAEYIEREAALSAQNKSMNLAECRKRLERLPATDVVPVVRCRDCKHRDPEDRKCDCGGLEHAHMFPVSDDWFCADGERKDGDGE